MPLLFKAYQSTLPSKDEKKKWHPRLIKIGYPVSTFQISEEIAKRSSLTVGDVLNVIDNLVDVMGHHLMNSRTVRLERLGNFTAIIQSQGTGVDTKEEVNADQITGLKIRFSPAYHYTQTNGIYRAMFSNVKFERYERQKADKTGKTDNE